MHIFRRVHYLFCLPLEESFLLNTQLMLKLSADKEKLGYKQSFYYYLTKFLSFQRLNPLFSPWTIIYNKNINNLFKKG